MKFRNLVTAGLMATGLAVSSGANAALTMTLDDGVSPLIIADDGVGDLNEGGGPIEGLITHFGTYGGFNFNISVGKGSKYLPTSQLLELSANLSSGLSGGGFTLTLVDDDVDSTGGWVNFGSTLTSATTYDVVSTASLESTITGDIVNFAPQSFGNGPAGQAENEYMSVALDGPLIGTIQMVFTAAGESSGVAGSTLKVPEPSVIALFGLGLVGLGFAARRRKI